MDLDDYQEQALRTGTDITLPIAALGLAGEVGEVVELVKKHLGHGHELDRVKLARELGDVLWYLAALAHLNGIPLSEVAERNVLKLKLRYPDGFSHDASKNRTE